MTNQNTFLYPIFMALEIATGLHILEKIEKRLRVLSDNIGIKNEKSLVIEGHLVIAVFHL